jgi:hypothetical protein
LEKGLRTAGVPLKDNKETWKISEPRKWRSYLVNVWKRNQKQYPELAELYDSKLTLAKTLLEEWVQSHPGCKLPVTFDNWYTEADFCRFIDQTLRLPYVGTLDGKNQVNLKSGLKSLNDFAQHLKEEHFQSLQTGGKPVFMPIVIPYKGEHETYYVYCNTHNLRLFGRQRLVISYRREDLSDAPAFFNSNRTVWQAVTIIRTRRHRWPVDVYHEEAKAEGLDQYQLRDFEAIQRHIALVAVVYSLLRAAQHDRDLQLKIQQQLKISLEGSAASWRRITIAQTLWCLSLTISIGLARGQSFPQIMAPLIRAIYPAG